jgi:hypothetical protein
MLVEKGARPDPLRGQDLIGELRLPRSLCAVLAIIDQSNENVTSYLSVSPLDYSTDQ